MHVELPIAPWVRIRRSNGGFLGGEGERKGKPSVLLTGLSLALLIGGAVPGLAASPANNCAARKLAAISKTFACTANAWNDNLLHSRPVDVTRCQARLENVFSHANASGDCVVKADSATAEALVADAETSLLALLDAWAVNSDQKAACEASINGLIARYASCRVKNWRQVLRGGDYPIYDNCYTDLQDSVDGNFQLCKAFLSTLSLSPVDPVENYLAGADLHGTEFFAADVRGAVLVDANLSGADLSGTSFAGARLSGANLLGVHFGGVSFTGADLGGLQLDGLDLSGLRANDIIECPATLPQDWVCIAGNLLGPYVDASGAQLADADLQGLVITGAELNDANLASANLRNISGVSARLFNSVLTGADLRGANLNQADLRDAVLTGVLFTGATLEYSLLGPDVSSLDLSGVDLHAADLFEASLAGSDLAGADLSGSELAGTDLTNANLSSADLTGAEIGVIWSNTTCPDGTNSDANGSTCCGAHLMATPYLCSP
jgi:uncharacterized protein YjbI with pentapeptide repeats